VKPSGYTATDLERLRAWTASRQLDFDWYPGAVAPESQYNIPSEPTLVRAARAAIAHPDSARRLAAAYPFEVAPASDARPYPHRFLRAGSLLAFLRSGATTWLPFAEWGYIALVATLVQSAVLAGVLIVLPAVVRSRAWRAQTAPRHPLVVYFSAIGLGYMAAEIAIIQQLTLLLGHPVYAVATVLAAILIWSGVGSVWSDRLRPSQRRILGAALTGSFALLALALLPIVHALQPAPILARGVIAAALLAPIGLVMGTMFPLGLRGLARDDSTRIAWAWAANGFASVVAVPLAALIAVEWGSRVLLVVAAVAYLAAFLITRGEGLGTASARQR
jgi:hypothetical protein